MSGVRLGNAARMEDIESLTTAYRRLATMDPPALRSLAGELRRIADDSSTAAGLEAGPAAQAKAARDAQRAAAAQAALVSVGTEG